MKASLFSQDIQEFLGLLDEHRVRYVIVGGEAVIYYGHARLTGDVDFFYDPSPPNALKIHKTLERFWDGDIPGLESPEDLKEPGIIMQFGMPPNRIDLINTIDGVTFEEAWTNRTTVEVEMKGRSVPVHFIGLDQLIRNKEAIQRPKDQEDLKYLREAKRLK
ncbi:MAG: nucleotidyltransferase [Deltaproteobacteria bacterium]|nr:nucleotidyltransferase [Deltaproteobacteria bacterium]